MIHRMLVEVTGGNQDIFLLVAILFTISCLTKCKLACMPHKSQLSTCIAACICQYSPRQVQHSLSDVGWLVEAFTGEISGYGSL